MLQTGMERLSGFDFFFRFSSPPPPQKKKTPGRLENAVVCGSLRTWYGRLLAKGPLAAAHFSCWVMLT